MGNRNISGGQFGGVSDEEYTHAHRVNNIISTYHRADDKTFRKGTEWYDRGHRLAKKLGQGNPEKGAAVLSALSPRTKWERNRNMGGEIATGKLSSESVEKMRAAKTPEERKTARGAVAGMHLSGQFTPNIIKAHDIYSGKRDPKTAFNPNANAKTRNFTRNLSNPNDPDAVTVDFRAHNVSAGSTLPKPEHQKLGKDAYYNKHADAYREAAKVIGAPTVHEVQGVTWEQNKVDEKKFGRKNDYTKLARESG